MYCDYSFIKLLIRMKVMNNHIYERIYYYIHILNATLMEFRIYDCFIIDLLDYIVIHILFMIPRVLFRGKGMNKGYLLAACACALAMISMGRAFGENVFLRDGGIINGSITRESALTVTVRKKDGKSETIPRGRIMRILYTELNMGKIHVQMRNGKNFEAYIVDEDQKTYTFRKELTSPQEETVKRSEVLFIAERNPSGLAGTAETDSASLTWYPPYNPVKHYRLYVSEKGKSDFRALAESRRTSYTVRDLRSNSAYVFKVTAIDGKNEESLPSNELELVTKNIRPNTPGEITAMKSAPGSDGAITATLRWQVATDPDGTIAGYSVYRHTEQGKKREAKVAAAEYTAHGLVPTVRNRFEITSVDDRGDESEDSADIIVGVAPWSWFVEARFDYVIPQGTFSDLYGPGYGGTLTAGMSGLPLDGLDLGVTAGCWYFEGEYRDTDSAWIAPVLAALRYRLNLFGGLYAVPAVELGYAYCRTTFKKRNASTFALDTVTESAFEPMGIAGLSLLRRITDTISLTAGGRYGVIYEQDESMRMVCVRAGAEMLW